MLISQVMGHAGAGFKVGSQLGAMMRTPQSKESVKLWGVPEAPSPTWISVACKVLGTCFIRPPPPTSGWPTHQPISPAEPAGSLVPLYYAP